MKQIFNGVLLVFLGYTAALQLHPKFHKLSDLDDKITKELDMLDGDDFFTLGYQTGLLKCSLMALELRVYK